MEPSMPPRAKRRHGNSWGGNPQGPQTAHMTISTGETTSTHRIIQAVREFMHKDVQEAIRNSQREISLVIYDTTLSDPTILSTQSPISTVHVSSLVILKEDTTTRQAESWLHKYCLDRTDVMLGEKGFETLLQSTAIGAVYIYVPAHLQSNYTLRALQAEKHVLLKDPVSTPLTEFHTQMKQAIHSGKFLQFSAMFVYHYTAQSFLDCVVSDNFGVVQEIDAILKINKKHLKFFDVRYPLSDGHGCIRILARFCVLMATLMLDSKCTPVKARVKDFEVDEASGEPIKAVCEIEFTGSVILKCDVGYCDTSTRQVLTVKSASNKHATMTDFVMPHPDGLSTYRVYDKQQVNGKLEIKNGECLDVPMGPPQSVTIWRKFHEVCDRIDQRGWESEKARHFTESALRTKHTLISLDESFSKAGACVPIDMGEGMWL